MDIEKIIKEVREAIIEGSEQVANSIMDSEAFEKYRNSPDKIGDFVDDLSVGINHLGDQIGDWFEKAKESTEPVRRRTKAALSDYEGAGMVKRLPDGRYSLSESAYLARDRMVGHHEKERIGRPDQEGNGDAG